MWILMYINNDGLPAYLDLAGKVGRLVRQAGRVAARPGEAPD
jgi:hypothetical protein